MVYVSFEEDDEGFIYIVAHPDKTALENQTTNNSYNNSSDSDSGSDDNEVTTKSPNRRTSLRTRHLESIQKRPHR